MTTSEIVADPGILERNLGMIAVRSPDAAARIRETAPSDAALFVETGDGTPALLFDGVAQCSKRHPVKEAESWARGIDPHGAAFFGVMGFGAGHHLAALSAAHKHKSVIVCCEPDVALLRAVLERIDHSGWMGRAPFVLITDPGDRASLSHARGSWPRASGWWITPRAFGEWGRGRGDLGARSSMSWARRARMWSPSSRTPG